MLRSKIDVRRLVRTSTKQLAFPTVSSSTRRNSFQQIRGPLIILPALLVASAFLGLAFYVQHTSVQTLAPMSVTNPLCGSWNDYLMPDSSSFTAVSALAKDDVWFLGPSGFAHWDGKSLGVLTGPDIKADEVFINDITFTSDDNGWAVGSIVVGEGSNRESQLLSLHWDGSVWNVIPTPQLGDELTGTYPGLPNKDANLEAISVISKNDVWAVGSYPVDRIAKTLTLHWEGVKWTIVPSPSAGDTDNYLLALASVSENDVWAFGLSKAGNQAWENKPLSMHWDGTSWQVMNSPKSLAEVRAASVSPTKDIWVVSLAENVMKVPPDGPSVLGSAVREQGSGWREAPVPYIYEAVLRSVVALSSDDVWAVGYTGTQSLAIHWDGTAWSEVPTPNPSERQNLVDVAAVDTGDIWAVGWSAGDEGSPKHPMIAHFVGCPNTTK